MGTWRDKVRKAATFRGVKFEVDSAEFSGGRRTVKHEYPQREKSFSEDLGRRARGFPVEAFLVGENFLEQLEDLIEALEAKGPGELVHPLHGARVVVCPGFHVRTRSSEGGFATVSIEFDETDDEPGLPLAKPDPETQHTASADALFLAVGVDLTALHNLEGLAATAIAGMAAVVSSASSKMRIVLGPIAATAQGLARLQSQLAGLSAQAGALVRAPASLLEQLGDTFLGLVPADPRAGVEALLAAYAFRPSSVRPPATTPKRLQEQTTYDAIQRTVQRMALVQASRAAVAGTAPAARREGVASSYPSYEDALVTRAAVLVAIDEQLELASDTVYPALMQLRADLVLAVPGDDSELAHLVAYTPPGTLPSLLLSHRLYGSLDREADLLARNNVRHPGFVTGQRALEVLGGG